MIYITATKLYTKHMGRVQHTVVKTICKPTDSFARYRNDTR